MTEIWTELDRVGLPGPSLSAVVASCFQTLYTGFNCSISYTMYILYSYLPLNCYGTRVGLPGCEAAARWSRWCLVDSVQTGGLGPV